MKKKVFYLMTAALVLVSMGFSSADVMAQAPITPVDTADYKNGVEKFIGTLLPGRDATSSFVNVGFTIPDSLAFTEDSYTLKVGKYYGLSNVNLIGDTLLYLNVDFQPLADAPFGDLLDTLVISADGATDFVLPIRGTTVVFDVYPTGIIFDSFFPSGGDTQTETLTITTANRRLDRFTYKYKDGNPVFSVDETGQTLDSPLSTITLTVTFTEPQSASPGAIFLDTLVVRHPSYPDFVYEIPASAVAAPISVYPTDVFFGKVALGDTASSDLTVELFNVQLDTILLTQDGPHYSFEKAPDWNPNKGGIITVYYAPDTVIVSDYATLTLIAGSDTIDIPIMGFGGPDPTITITPGSYTFVDVPVGETWLSDRITVVLDNPYGTHLTDPGAIYIANDPNEVFFIETIQPSPTTGPDTVYVTVSFTPIDETPVSAELIATAAKSAGAFIELSGNGVESSAPALSPQQTTALSATEASTAPKVSVLEGDIVVSKAPEGSSVIVYNLQGQALKTQGVASDKEVVKTASFPKNVYIVLVNDKKQIILKQKVLL
jgi:hypothetical protein